MSRFSSSAILHSAELALRFVLIFVLGFRIIIVRCALLIRMFGFERRPWLFLVCFVFAHRGMGFNDFMFRLGLALKQGLTAVDVKFRPGNMLGGIGEKKRDQFSDIFGFPRLMAC